MNFGRVYNKMSSTSCKSAPRNHKELPMNIGLVLALAFGTGVVEWRNGRVPQIGKSKVA